MTLALTGRSWIAGLRSAGSAPAGRAIEAATGRPLEPLYLEATDGELDRACRAAAEAFESTELTEISRRAALLRAVADRIEALGEPLLERAHLETALPMDRMRTERGRTCGQLRFFASLIEEGSWIGERLDPAQPQRTPLAKPEIRCFRVPIGPVAVFCASNFPLAFSVAGVDTAAALAAGCPAVVHAHFAHPGTAEAIGTVITEAVAALGFPEGTFSLLYGAGHGVGRRLVEHPAIRAVGFTGSRAGGRALMDLAARRPEPIPVYAEMSSVNPLFILPGALAGRGAAIARGLHSSATLGVGQFCTKPGLIFLERGAAAASFERELAALYSATAAQPMLHAGIRAGYEEKRRRVRAGARLVAQGAEPASPQQAQAFLHAVEAERFLADPRHQEEVFGPSALLVICDHHSQMLQCARSLEGQLTATLHAEPSDRDSAHALARILVHRAGRLVWNGYPTGVEISPAMVHGGPYPATSDSRSSSVGSLALERYSRWVSVQGAEGDALALALRKPQ
ncbi:MAG: aldehyde dehydrogenase (NADP(+)) [Planctomycetes bacterium]|nr:aldehyde dehydrogenase (NADP(+)) [Planctomycetota bacterium]